MMQPSLAGNKPIGQQQKAQSQSKLLAGDLDSSLANLAQNLTIDKGQRSLQG